MKAGVLFVVVMCRFDAFEREIVQVYSRERHFLLRGGVCIAAKAEKRY